MADLYIGYGETNPMEFEAISPSPDSFFTMKRGETLESAFAKARHEWPQAKVVYAEEDDDSDED